MAVTVTVTRKTTGALFVGQKVAFDVRIAPKQRMQHKVELSCPLFRSSASKRLRESGTVEAELARAGEDAEVTVRYNGKDQPSASQRLSASELHVSFADDPVRSDVSVLRPTSNTYGAGKATVHLRLDNPAPGGAQATVSGTAFSGTKTVRFSQGASEASVSVNLKEGKNLDITLGEKKNCAVDPSSKSLTVNVDVPPKVSFAAGDGWRTPAADVCQGDQQTFHVELDREATKSEAFADLEVDGSAVAEVRFEQGSRSAQVEHTFDAGTFPRSAKITLVPRDHARKGSRTSKTLKLHKENRVSVLSPKEKGPFYPGDTVTFVLELKYKPDLQGGAKLEAGKLVCADLFADQAVTWSQGDPLRKEMPVQLRKDIKASPATTVTFEPADGIRRDEASYGVTLEVDASALMINFAEGDAWMEPPGADLCVGDEVTVRTVLNRKNATGAEKVFAELHVGGRKAADVKVADGADTAETRVKLEKYGLKTSVELQGVEVDGRPVQAGGNAKKQVAVHQENKVSVFAPERAGPYFKGDKVPLTVKLKYQPEYADDAEQKKVGHLKAYDLLHRNLDVVFTRADGQEKTVELEITRDIQGNPKPAVELETAPGWRLDTGHKKVTLQCREALEASFAGKPDPAGPFYAEDEARVQISFAVEVPGDPQGAEVEAGRIVSRDPAVELYHEPSGEEKKGAVFVVPGQKKATAVLRVKKAELDEEKEVELAFEAKDGTVFAPDPKKGTLTVKVRPLPLASLVAPKDWGGKKNDSGVHVFYVDEKPAVTVKLATPAPQGGARGRIVYKGSGGSDVEAGTFEIGAKEKDRADVELSFPEECGAEDLRVADVEGARSEAPPGGQAPEALRLEVKTRSMVCFPEGGRWMDPPPPARLGQEVTVRVALSGRPPETGGKPHAKVRLRSTLFEDGKLDLTVPLDRWPSSPDQPAAEFEQKAKIAKAEKKAEVRLVRIRGYGYFFPPDAKERTQRLEARDANVISFGRIRSVPRRWAEPEQKYYLPGDKLRVRLALKESSAGGDLPVARLVSDPPNHFARDAYDVVFPAGKKTLDLEVEVRYDTDAHPDFAPVAVKPKMDIVPERGVKLADGADGVAPFELSWHAPPAVRFAETPLKGGAQRAAPGDEMSVEILDRKTLCLELSEAPTQNPAVVAVQGAPFGTAENTTDADKRRMYRFDFPAGKTAAEAEVEIADCPEDAGQRFVELRAWKGSFARVDTENDKHKLKLRITGTALVLDEDWISPRAETYGWMDKVAVRVKRTGEDRTEGEKGTVTSPAFGKAGSPPEDRSFPVRFEADETYAAVLVPLDTDEDDDKPPSTETDPGILLHGFDPKKPMAVRVEATDPDYRAKGDTAERSISVRKRYLYVSPNQVKEKHNLKVRTAFALLTKLSVPLPEPASEADGLEAVAACAAFQGGHSDPLAFPPGKDSLFTELVFDRSAFQTDLTLEIRRLPSNPHCLVLLPDKDAPKLSEALRLSVRKPLVGFAEKPFKERPAFVFDGSKPGAAAPPRFARRDTATVRLRLNEAVSEELRATVTSPLFGRKRNEETKVLEERTYEAVFAAGEREAEVEVTFYRKSGLDAVVSLAEGETYMTDSYSRAVPVTVLRTRLLSFPSRGWWIRPGFSSFAAGDEAVLRVRLSRPARKAGRYGVLRCPAFDDADVSFEKGERFVEVPVTFRKAEDPSVVVALETEDEDLCLPGFHSTRSLTVHEKRTVSFPEEGALDTSSGLVPGNRARLRLAISPPAVEEDACSVTVKGPVKDATFVFAPGEDGCEGEVEASKEDADPQALVLADPKGCEADGETACEVRVYRPKISFADEPVKDPDAVLPGEWATFFLTLDRPAPRDGVRAYLSCPEAFVTNKVKNPSPPPAWAEEKRHPVVFTRDETRAAASVRLRYDNALEDQTKTVELSADRNCQDGSALTHDLAIHKAPKIGFADPWLDPSDATVFETDDPNKNSATVSVVPDEAPGKDVRAKLLSPAFGGRAYVVVLPAGSEEAVRQKVFFTRGKADSGGQPVEQRVMLVGLDGWHADPENREKKVKVKPPEEPSEEEKCPLTSGRVVNQALVEEAEEEPDWDALLESPCNLHRMFLTVKHGGKASSRGPGGKGTFEVVPDKSLAKVPEDALVNPPGGRIPILQVVAGREGGDPHVPKMKESVHFTTLEVDLDPDDVYCRQVYLDPQGGGFLRHPILTISDKIKGKADWRSKFAVFSNVAQKYVIKPVVTLAELPTHVQQQVAKLEDVVLDKVKDLYETHVDVHRKKVLTTVGEAIGLEPDIVQEETETPPPPKRPFRGWKARHEWWPVLPLPGNVGALAEEKRKKKEPLYVFPVFQARQPWHESFVQGSENPALPLGLGEAGHLELGSGEEEEKDPPSGWLSVGASKKGVTGSVSKPGSGPEKKEEEEEEDPGETQEKQAGFGFISDILSILAFPFMRPRQYLVHVEGCGIPSTGGVPDEDAPVDKGGPCADLKAIVEVYPSDEFCLHYDFKLPDNSLTVGAKGDHFDPKGEKILDKLGMQSGKVSIEATLDALEAPTPSRGPQFLASANYVDIVRGRGRKKETGTPRRPSLVFHPYGSSSGEEEESRSILSKVFSYFKEQTSVQVEGEDYGAVLDLDGATGGKISDVQSFLDDNVFSLDFLSDYNIALTRNGRTGSFYYKITRAIGATIKSVQTIAAVFNGFSEGCSQGMGYGVEFGVKFLEGGLSGYWGWKEHTDHRAFKWYSLQIDLTLLEVFAQVYAGYVASAVLVKFKAIVYLKASLDAKLNGGFEHQEPGLKPPSFLDLWTVAEGKVEVGIHIVLVHEDIFQANAAVRTGYQLKFRASPPIPKGLCVEYEVYWMGITAMASFKIVGFKEKKKEIKILEGSPSELPWMRGVWPKKARETWWNVRKTAEIALKAAVHQRTRLRRRFDAWQELQYYMMTHPRLDTTQPLEAHETPGYDFEGESEDWISEKGWKAYLDNWNRRWEECRKDFLLEDRTVNSRSLKALNRGNLYRRLTARVGSIEQKLEAWFLPRLRRLDQIADEVVAFQRKVFEKEDEADEGAKPPPGLLREAKALLKHRELHFKTNVFVNPLREFDGLLKDLRHYADKRLEWRPKAEDPFDVTLAREEVEKRGK